MAEELNHPSHSLYDFGPLAQEYDQWYETQAGQVHDRVQKADVLRVLRRPRLGDRLLDVGCGTGHWSRFFASVGYEVYGVDISPEMIAVARSAAAGICIFEVADVYQLPFEDASFDVVAAMATLEFLPDAATAVTEMVRCVKLDGTLLLGTLNRLSPLNQRRLAGGEQPYVSGRLFTPTELRALLSPWGRVRMVASSLRGSEEQDMSPQNTGESLSNARGNLQGAFIVAEVQRCLSRQK
ncbi:MAG TPA: methyltransferase domain-containing protein [Armatimonadota bacterium]|nr:methyltransferase domain-containing protein [Armatimonadota bacterium]